jgi:hypothetical protein
VGQLQQSGGVVKGADKRKKKERKEGWDKKAYPLFIAFY